MILFITALILTIAATIAFIFLTIKAYSKRKNNKRNRKIISFDDSKRKKDNYSLFMSVCGFFVSVIGVISTLLYAIPAPTIYPLDNETSIYSDNTEITIKSGGFDIYYSLDGSDPKNGMKYENSIFIEESTTISARNKFLWKWSDIVTRAYSFSDNSLDLAQTLLSVSDSTTQQDDKIVSITETTQIQSEPPEIKQNFDLIQQMKASYSDADTMVIKSDSIKFSIYETAGYVYQDTMKTGESKVIGGKSLELAKMFIFDYDSDKIIEKANYISDLNGEILYTHGNSSKFYGVTFYEDYKIYVTPPIMLIGGEDHGFMYIYLEKEDSEYTPLFQVRLYKKDLKYDELYPVVPSGDKVIFTAKKIFSNDSCIRYVARLNDSGILSKVDGGGFFSLNTNYVIDFLLYSSNSDLCLGHQTFDGSIKNSNLIYIYLESEGEDDIE